MSKIRIGVPKHNPRQGPGVRRTSYRLGDTRAPKLKPSPEFALFETSNGSRRNENLRAFGHSCKNFLKNLQNFPRIESRPSDNPIKKTQRITDRVETYNFKELSNSLESLLGAARNISSNDLCNKQKTIERVEQVRSSFGSLAYKLKNLTQEGFINDKYHEYIFSDDLNSSDSGTAKFTGALAQLERLLKQVQESFSRFQNLDQGTTESAASQNSQSKKAPPSFKPKTSKVKTKPKDEDPWRAFQVYSGNLFKGITKFFKKPNIVFNSLKNLRVLARRKPVVQDNVKRTLQDVKSSFESMLAQPLGEEDKVDLLQKALGKTKETLETLAA